MKSAQHAARSRAPGVATKAPRGRLGRFVVFLAVGYPVVLVGVYVALRFIGESWWITTIGLYLPRVVLAAPAPFFLMALLALRLRRWAWTQGVALLLVVFPLMGLVLPWPHGAAASAPTLRIMSYNVNSCFSGVPGIVAEIDAHAPDVVLLQEVAHAEELTPLLEARFPSVAANGQFVMATREHIVSADEPAKLTYAGSQRSPRFMRYVLDTPLGRVVVYSVHPVSPREDFYALRGSHGFARELLSGRAFTGAAVPRIRANAGLRTLQAQTFAAAAAGESDPVIVAGDTNLPTASPVFSAELGRFQDGFVKASSGFGYTYPNDRRPWMRIDRVLASDALRFVRFDVGDSKASDHLAVVADVQKAGRAE